ncbi:MAG: hypothetical protein JXR86_14730 [Spirochaetales bacterium]|nr:hypothetical protein [Spirochaetales bacterium]
MRLFTYFFSVLILISSSVHYIFGQDTASIEREEAPTALWQMDINDADVDLYIAGYWKIGVIGGLSMESGPDGIIFPAAFPGLTDFRFYQEPDITISLWLKNRYYLETTFLEGFDKNIYAIGYRGEEGEILQAVRIGNSEIAIENYEGISVPAPEYNTPGLSADFQTGISTHDVMIRYDPSSEQKKTFLGEYEVTEELLELGDFKRGQYFILPDDNIDTGSLEIYIADKNGIYTSIDGNGDPYRNFRKASADEYSFSNARGTVTLTEPAESDVVVYYAKSGLPVGNISLGAGFIVPLINGEPDPSDTPEDFNWTEPDSWFPDLGNYNVSRAVTVNSLTGLKIFSPGTISPFESYNIYDIDTALPSEKWKTEAYLADNSLRESDDSGNYSFTPESDTSRLIVNYNSESDPRSAFNRYPFADSYPQIYTVASTERSKTGRVILLSVRSGSGISLGPGVVPGSEQISINGAQTGAAAIDYSSGKVTFSRYIYPHDRIEILYRTETTDMAGGDLLVAQGNRFYPNENLELYFAEMFRWNIAGDAATTESESSPGGITVAGGLSYKRENFNLSVRGSGGFYTPDTTGTLRVSGMEESGYSFSAGRDLVKPVPGEIWNGSAPLSTGRADLTYKDYLSTDGLGQFFLNSYNWSGAAENGDFEGPSPAAELSSDPFGGNVMVFDYDLAPGEWSAGDLLLTSDGPIDLSNYESISLYIQTENPADITAKILLGENGEADDYDGDGFTENYNESLIVAIGPVDLTGTANQWKEIEHSFTSEERKKLTRSRSVRILIESAGGATGRLMAGGLLFEGSIFKGTVSDGDSSGNDNLYTEERSDIDSTVAALSTSFSEINEIFHAAGEEQKALRIKWELSDAAQDGWTAETHTLSVSPDSYSTFSFYIQSAYTPGIYNIELTDSRNRGYHFSYTITSSDWEKINLSLESGIVTLSDGTQITAAAIDADRGELNRFSIESKSLPSDTGTIYLDELHYSDPSFSLAGTIELLTDYTRAGPLLQSSGGFPFFADFSISNEFTYYGGTVLSDAAEPYSSMRNYTSIGITMLLLEIQANGEVNYGESGTRLSGSHSLLFPSGFPYAQFSDSYSRSGTNDSSAMTRANNFKLSFPGYGNLFISTAADGNEDKLVQNWSAETDWNLFDKLMIRLKSRLEQTEDWDFRNKGNYFSNWINDYSLIAPYDENVSNRNFNVSFKIALETVPLGFIFDPALSFDLDENSGGRQTDYGTFGFSIPVTLVSSDERTWVITPSYSRDFMERRDSVDSGSFRQGFKNLFEDLSNWMPLTSFIPFYELFADDQVNLFEEKTSSLNSAAYTPGFAINFATESGSGIKDLFIPNSFEASATRTFTKKDDGFSSINKFNFQLKQSAINLFGRFGVYETFSFYDSEDITSSLQFLMEGENGDFPVPKELVYQHYLAFYGAENRTLILENRFSSDFAEAVLSDTLDLNFLWRRETREKFSLDFLNRLIKNEHYWSHEERVQLDIILPGEDNDDGLTSLNIFLKHISTAHVPGLGALKGWLTLGFYKDEERFRTGFEAGIEMEISF